jgi:PAS domain S-box-containing protein
LRAGEPASISEAESVLADLAQVFFQNSPASAIRYTDRSSAGAAAATPKPGPNIEARYKVLLDQLPAVVFMAYLDEGMGEAYVSPQIEATLGFTQKEWLEDPVRWYQRIHPEDKERWSVEAASMFLSGDPLRSSYRVIARDGHVVWFQCEARLVRREDGTPWFMHGVGFDITELKRTESALQEQRNVVSAVLETVGALVVVLDRTGRIMRFNRACEQTTGFDSEEVIGRLFSDLFPAGPEQAMVRDSVEQLARGILPADRESEWITKRGEVRSILWSQTVLTGSTGVTHIIATGTDLTERKQLERAVLEISSREQRRIGQYLHDGLGQHLTGIAFLSRVLQDRLTEDALPEAAAAGKIVGLINDSIKMSRELAHGLLPVVSEARGLMSALSRWSGEVSDLFHISCRFECPEPVLIHDEQQADHLYHLAREAVTNAIKHGKPRSVVVTLASSGDRGSLTVQDDGSGFVVKPDHVGLGLRIMKYRATMIGGSLELTSCTGGGALVACTFPIRREVGFCVE